MAFSTRSFICTAPNPWRYPAKDRSGRLDQLEPPDLGKLISKLTRPGSAASPDLSAVANSNEKATTERTERSDQWL